MTIFKNYKFKIIAIIISVVCILIGFCMVWIWFCSEGCYEKDYFGKVGLTEYKDSRKYLYAQMLNDFGKPLKVEEEENGSTHAVYKDLIFSYFENDLSAWLTNIKILSPDYRFGRKSIGVGSSKEDVLNAYMRVSRSPDEGYIWIEPDGLFVEYKFENDVVSSITTFYGDYDDCKP